MQDCDPKAYSCMPSGRKDAETARRAAGKRGCGESSRTLTRQGRPAVQAKIRDKGVTCGRRKWYNMRYADSNRPDKALDGVIELDS